MTAAGEGEETGATAALGVAAFAGGAAEVAGATAAGGLLAGACCGS